MAEKAGGQVVVKVEQTDENGDAISRVSAEWYGFKGEDGRLNANGLNFMLNDAIASAVEEMATGLGVAPDRSGFKKK